MHIFYDKKWIDIKELEDKRIALRSAIERLEGEYKELDECVINGYNHEVIPYIDDLIEKSVIMETLKLAQENNLSKEDFMSRMDPIEKEWKEYCDANHMRYRKEGAISELALAYRELGSIKYINEDGAEFINPYRAVDDSEPEAWIRHSTIDCNEPEARITNYKMGRELMCSNFNDYQYATEETAIYPKEKALEYLALGMVGEAGEVANKVKKVLRGDKEADQDFIKDIEGELGDILWYMSQLATHLGLQMNMVARSNIKKLRKRKEESKIKGDGDNR